MAFDPNAASLRVGQYFCVPPAVFPTERFQELTQAKWQPGGGTTCAFLTAEVLLMIGCRDNRIVNADSDDGSTRFEIAMGVSKMVQGAKALNCWQADGPGLEPDPGDLIFISNGPPATEHVEIVKDPGAYEAYAAGQGSREVQIAQVVERKVDDRRASGGPRMLSGPIALPGGAVEFRKVQGWVRVALVPLTADPIGAAVEPALPGVPTIAALSTGVLVAGALVGVGVLGAGVLAAVYIAGGFDKPPGPRSPPGPFPRPSALPDPMGKLGVYGPVLTPWPTQPDPMARIGVYGPVQTPRAPIPPTRVPWNSSFAPTMQRTVPGFPMGAPPSSSTAPTLRR